MKNFILEFLRAARQGPRLYFAPLIGAIDGVRNAMKESS